MALRLDLRSASLVMDSTGHQQWREADTPTTLQAGATALLLCDVWNDHTSRGAVERLVAMVPTMAAVVERLREQGATIVHCPSNCMEFYAESAARQRVVSCPASEPPPELEHDDPPLPIPSNQGQGPYDDGPFADTDEPTWQGSEHAVAQDWYGGRDYPWWRQHEGIRIDDAVDGISDDGREVYSFLKSRGVTTVIVMGVHTNVTRRPLAFHPSAADLCAAPLADHGCTLCRCAYSIARSGSSSSRSGGWTACCCATSPTPCTHPARSLPLPPSQNAPLLKGMMCCAARPPYVSHDEGTQLVVKYIEKFWCPSALGAQLLTPRLEERWTKLHGAKL